METQMARRQWALFGSWMGGGGEISLRVDVKIPSEYSIFCNLKTYEN